MGVTVPEPTGLLSIRPRQWLVLMAVQTSTLLFGMTVTIANVVLPQMRGTLSATQDEISWVITFNLVATAVATPISGWLANRLGWRRLMLLSLIGFIIASALCGLATSLESLIVFRVAQGVFGAPIMPVGQAILLASFPLRLHATVMVMWGVGAVCGPVFGPIFGSIIAEIYDWRTAFFMLVPAGLLAIGFALISLPRENPAPIARFDWTGFIALSLAITGAQLVMDRGQRLDWFESSEIILCVVVALLAFWVFAAHCLTAEQPFLDPRLLLNRNFTVGTLIAFVMGMLSYVSLALFPSLLHDLRGYPDDAIGLLLAGRGVGNWFAFLVIVPFSKLSARGAVAAGLLAQAWSAWAMAGLDINLTPWDVFMLNLVQGFGFGLAFTPLMVLSFATLPRHQLNEGTAVFTLVRNFGSSIFISIAVVLLVRSTSANYARLTELITPTRHLITLPEAWDTASSAGLLRLSREILRQASMIGYINGFTLTALVAAAGIALVPLLRGIPKQR
jgi:DHA2 family multidrug resistance protein